ncbi:MAG: ABC transporter ATP-binding protein [Desulfobacterota bacterium]|nr:ABC transporter ATP-binding protein [Thermodesulfobacteriota bacterium]
MLRLTNINCYYGTIHCLKNVSLHVDEREIVVLIGGNGSGKTTLLKAILGRIPVHSGTIIFQGQDFTRLPTTHIVASGIALVPEGRQIFGALSVIDNLMLGAYHRVLAGDRTIKDALQGVLELFPVLAQRCRQLAGTLSGGEQQMLAIGRALMAAPKLLLLDEPSMGLAPMVVNDIFDTIRKVSDRGTTILLVEQNAKKALSLADRGYVLETGKIIMQGACDELMENETVQTAYLGRSRQTYEERHGVGTNTPTTIKEGGQL